MEVNDLWSGQYLASKNISFKSSMLWWDLSDNSDRYIVVKRRIGVRGTNNAIKKP